MAPVGGAVPPQLNATAFAACLVLGGGVSPHPTPDLAAIKSSYSLSATDGLLVYMAVYPGQREPFLNASVQQPAWQKFAPPYWSHEAKLAHWMNTTASITPGAAFGVALESCELEHSNVTAQFCAAMTLHNTLRALGRSSGYVDKHGVDYLPDWYKADLAGWAAAAARMKANAMINLQKDGGGGCRNTSQAGDDCWGEWYHVAGVIAFGIHEAAVLGTSAGHLASWVFSALNAIWAKYVIGHPEDPTKAQIDRDAANMVAAYVDERGAPAGFDAASCAGAHGYVNTAA